MLERFVAGDLLETGPDCLSTDEAIYTYVYVYICMYIYICMYVYIYIYVWVIKTLRDSKAEHAQTSLVGISTMTLIAIHGFGSADMDRYGDMGLFEH